MTANNAYYKDSDYLLYILSMMLTHGTENDLL